MEIVRGIPNKYLSVACTILSFVLFYAAGVAFGQSMFYGAVFLIVAILFFFVAVIVGRRSGVVE